MKIIKWGIIGTGRICTRFCEALAELENAEIAAVCSRDRQRGEDFAERFDIAAVYTDVNEMCAQADIDVVYIGTPNQAHLSGMLTAFENGKNVLCEKPIALNERQAKEAAAAARENGVFLMEAMWVRFLPAVRQVQKWVNDGRIGEVRQVVSTFNIDAPEGQALERQYSLSMGGGALLDLGVYPLCAASMFLGKVNDIKYTEARLSASGVDMDDTFVLDCEKGTAYITCGFNYPSNSAAIYGTDGQIFISGWCGARSAYLYSGETYGELTESFSLADENGMKYEAMHVMDCLEKGLTESPEYPIDASVAEMAVLDALRERWGVEFTSEDEPYEPSVGRNIANAGQPVGVVPLCNAPDWYRDAVFYHIYPLGMCGAPSTNDLTSQPVNRLNKILELVGHISSIGFNAVYFGPVFESNAHGYDTVDYQLIDRRLGTNADFARLCSELHSRGIRVVLDGVFNHVGRDFWAFRDVREKRWDSRYCSWFNINFDGNSGYNDGFWYEGWEGHFELVKLNLGNPEVREYIFNCVRGWMKEFAIDGLRLDVAYMLDQNFLRELRSVCKAERSDFFLLGECIHGDYSRLVNDSMLDSVTNYECYKGLHSSINAGNMHEIGYSLHRQFGQESWCIYRGMSLYAFVDNHDVSRISTVLGDPELLPVAYALLFAMPGIPSVYYGSELGISGDKSAGDAVLRPELTMSDVKHMRNALTSYIARLCAARQQSEALRRGSYRQLYVNSHQLVFERCVEGERVICAFNTADQTHYAHFDAGEGRAIDLLTGRSIDFGGGLEIPPKSAYIGKVY